MSKDRSYLQIEDPDKSAVVDFLSKHFAVTISVDGDTVYIQAKASHGEDHSTWDSHDFEFTLPNYEGREEEDDSEDG